jgi:transposase InsO family protein
MHPTLKKEATKPPSLNFLEQQDRFDQFIDVYNNERPQQSLGGHYPGELYTPFCA